MSDYLPPTTAGVGTFAAQPSRQIEVIHRFPDPIRIESIARIEQKLDYIIKEIATMSTELDNLTQAVTAENTVIDSVVTLLVRVTPSNTALRGVRRQG